MLEPVQTVRALDGRGCTWAGAIRLGVRALAGHDLDSRMSREPRRQGSRLAIVEEGHGPAALKVKEARPGCLACPIGPIIHPEAGGGGMHRQGEPTSHTPERVSADGSTQALASLRPRRPAEGHRDLRQPLHQPVGPPGPGRDALGPALGAAAARAAPVGAAQLPDLERSHHTEVCPRESRAGAFIVTVDASRGKAAHGTVHPRLSRGDAPGQLGCPLVQMPRLQVSGGTLREHARPEFHRPPGLKPTGAARRFLSEKYPSGQDVVGDYGTRHHKWPRTGLWARKHVVIALGCLYSRAATPTPLPTVP